MAPPKKSESPKVKFHRPSPLAAYVVAIDIVDPDEAEALGLIVVESDPHGYPLSHGKYLPAEAPEDPVDPNADAEA